MSLAYWTDERVEQLKALHAEGLSFRLIANVMGGISRNGVLGKASRLCLPQRGETIRANARSYQPSIRLPRVRPAPKPVVRPIPETAPERIGVIGTFPDELAAMPKTCRWIDGDPLKPDWQCCGHETGGGPWCPYHGAKMKTKSGGSVFVIQKKSVRVTGGWAA